MRFTLLGIDMQPHKNFASIRPMEPVKRVMRLTMNGDNWIVLTQLTHWGNNDDAFPGTHKELRDLVSGYRHVHFVDKSCSSAALHTKNSRNAEIENSTCFVLVGCNTDGCVLATAVGLTTPDGTKSAYGLIDLFPGAQIIVIKEGCDTISDAADPFEGFAKYPQIRLLETVDELESMIAAAN